MITRILKIRDFRGFKNWLPEAGLAPFADINLVYGANGSGKSTLASLLRAKPRPMTFGLQGLR